MAGTSIADRRVDLSESQVALLQREKELDEKERRIIDMINSKSSDDKTLMLQNLSSCLAAERQALAHRWSVFEAETKAVTNLEQSAFSVACSLGGKLASAPLGDQSMTREVDGTPHSLLSPLSDWPSPRLQTSYCAIWSVQQIQLVSLAQQQQQADMPCFSCCFQR
jgi:hypothetical protein